MWMRSLPLIQKVFQAAIHNNLQRQSLLLNLRPMIQKIRSLINYVDNEYNYNNINDPFLIISLIRLIFNTLSVCKTEKVEIDQIIHKDIEKMIVHIIA